MSRTKRMKLQIKYRIMKRSEEGVRCAQCHWQDDYSSGTRPYLWCRPHGIHVAQNGTCHVALGKVQENTGASGRPGTGQNQENSD